jgi:arylsulfatase A-like enzyme
VLQALRETGFDRTTLVAFTADNGGSLPHGQSNRPWRDGKTSHYDGGLRVPFIVRWPGRIPPGTRCDYAGQSFDIFPTCLELAGRPRAKDLDAASLVPLFAGGTLPSDRELYFTRREGGRGHDGKSYECLIKGRWKLMQNAPYRPLELYDLDADPRETTDLAASRGPIVKELAVALQRHVQRGGTVAWQSPAADPAAGVSRP